MTQYGSFMAWWRRSRQAQEPLISVVPKTVTKPRVTQEYSSLHAYLDHCHASTIVLSFIDMESLLGHPLPDAARTDGAWWTAAASRSSKQAEAWTAAGRTAAPNLAARNVVFERRR